MDTNVDFNDSSQAYALNTQHFGAALKADINYVWMDEDLDAWYPFIVWSFYSTNEYFFYCNTNVLLYRDLLH